MSDLFDNEIIINEFVKGEVIIEEQQEVDKRKETINEIIKDNKQLLISYEDLKIISKKSDNKYAIEPLEIYILNIIFIFLLKIESHKQLSRIIFN